MKLSEDIQNEIIDALSPLNLSQIILFGSYAWGEPGKDSDIDLYVVIDEDFYPKDFNEKSKLYMAVSDAMDNLYRKKPFDLIVHTKPMHDRFLQLDSMFCRKIMKDGKRLL